MKRLFVMLAVALAATALMAGTSSAAGDDAKGPACTDVIDGVGGYVYDPTTDSGTVQVDLTLEAPACAAANYLLDIYDFSGAPLLVADISATSISGTTVTFVYSFAAGTAPNSGVCVAAETLLGRHVADRAPDSGCSPVEANSSGGGQGFS